MIDYLELGPSPCDEDCAQVGDDNYEQKARAECQSFISLLRKTFGNEPEGAKLIIKSNPHDYGRYYEVAVKFDDNFPKSIDYAFNVENNAPTNWE